MVTDKHKWDHQGAWIASIATTEANVCLLTFYFTGSLELFAKILHIATLAFEQIYF